MSISPVCGINARECFDGPAAPQEGILGALIVWWPTSFWLQWTMVEGSVHAGIPVAGANGVAAGSSLARPRHRWWKGPVKIGWENFHRWWHYLKLVNILPNFTVFSDENSMVRHPVCIDPPPTATKCLCWSRRRNACLLDVAAIRICRVRTRWLSWIMTLGERFV